MPAVLFLVGVTILFVALARPEMELNHPRREGTVILAFDVSASMKADDLDADADAGGEAGGRATFVGNQPPVDPDRGRLVQHRVVRGATTARDVKADVLEAIRRLAPERRDVGRPGNPHVAQRDRGRADPDRRRGARGRRAAAGGEVPRRRRRW